jgi:hypothetical protein
VVIDPKGGRAELRDDALGGDTLAVVEDTLGSFWISSDRGLLQVTATETAKGVVLKRGTLHEKDVPSGTCFLMCKDLEDNLWFYGPGPDRGNRLYRVRLAPVP